MSKNLFLYIHILFSIISQIFLIPAVLAQSKQSIQFKEIKAQLLQLFPLENEDSLRFVRMPPCGSEQSTFPEDYFALVRQKTNNKVLRFKSMPIPIYIAADREVNFSDTCLKSFAMWEDATHGLVSFVQVNNAEIARIEVVFSHLGINKNNSNCALGAHTMTKLLKGNDGLDVPPQIVEVNLDLIESKPSGIRLLVLQNMVAHEIGHALGILAHSPMPFDLMYERTDQYSHISSRDLKTLELIYQAPADIPL